jgi:hypothetical protein
MSKWDMSDTKDAPTIEHMMFLQDALKVSIETIKQLTADNERLRSAVPRLNKVEQHTTILKLLK